MTTHQKRKLPLVAILTLPMILLLLGGVWAFVTTISVSGTATLPNGVPIAISADVWGFSVAENSKSTKIKIAGRVIEFGTSTINVDGVEVGVMNDSAKQVSLTADGEGVTLVTDGNVIVLDE